MSKQQNLDESLKDWRVPIDENTKSQLLLGHNLIDNQAFQLSDIYLSDIAIAVHIIWASTSRSDKSSEGSEVTKKTIGSFLRQLEGNSEQLGFMLPMVAIIQTSAEDKTIVETVDQWAADQDWHRGDFSIFRAESDKESEEIIWRVLSASSEVWANIEPMVPLNDEQYLEKLRSARAINKLSPEHDSLLDCIELAWRTASPMQHAVTGWLDDMLKEIDELRLG